MIVHRSNRTERLVEVLAEVVARPPADPWARECIVVQGKGMERWLSMELARRLGAWANPDFPFPRRLIDRAIAAVLGNDAAGAAAFEPESLMWSVAELLPTFLDHKDFGQIRAYLNEDAAGLKLSQLAARIADILDHYVVYRPAMIAAWESGAETHWQAALWRALVARHGSGHLAARARAFVDALSSGRAVAGGFPRRISLFGIATLPPLYLHLLDALSAAVEVHLFVLSPSREYWAEIRSKREMIRELSRHDTNAGTTEEALHLEEGHPLLASLGRVGRDFQHVLEGTAAYEEPGRDLYEEPTAAGMLAVLQSDILHLRRRGGAPGEIEPLSPRADDDSISVHSCHSPMREVEVLHDRLLALFDADRTLLPRDVVVMTPEIDRYAPLIEAVFGNAHAAEHRIPFSIADRSARTASEVLDAFLQLLAVIAGRLTAPEVLDLLGLEVIRERFGIEAEDVDTVRQWIAGAGIRWAMDAAHRESLGQPALPQNTWRFGLDRLLLGYAMPGREETLYHDVLPYDDVEGKEADLLGRVVDFCSTLFRFRASLRSPRPPAAWQKDLGELLDTMILSAGRTARQHQRIRLALANVVERARIAGFTGAVDREVMTAQLSNVLQRGHSSRGFLSGGVTFCELVPMRTIPFRVVCLIGMNDDAFPRTRHAPGFDLIARRPMTGDRTQREDDRYLFLEALLSARERLLVTYVGQSIRDNTEIPPSVVVTELLDTLGESFPCPPGGASPPAFVALRHPLQPFSPRYFDREEDPQLFSYSADCLEGARKLAAPKQKESVFVSAPIALDPGEPRVIAVEDLVRFFESPVRTFLRRRLDLHLQRDEMPLEDREPAELSGMERWAVGEALLSRALRGEDPATAFAAVRAAGRLPPGVPGRCVYDDLIPEVAALGAMAKAVTAGPPREALEVDGEVEGSRITGLIRNMWNAGQVRCQFARINARQELAMWIRHVVLNWAAARDCPKETTLVGRSAEGNGAAIVRFGPLNDPATVLAALVRLYWLGLQTPLPLFPETSHAYARAVAREAGDEAREKALESARRSFQGSSYSRRPAEGDDPSIRQVFANQDPFAGAPSPGVVSGAVPVSFESIARIVFDPLLSHREGP